jgi:hypothetical protein
LTYAKHFRMNEIHLVKRFQNLKYNSVKRSFSHVFCQRILGMPAAGKP